MTTTPTSALQHAIDLAKQAILPSPETVAEWQAAMTTPPTEPTDAAKAIAESMTEPSDAEISGLPETSREYIGDLQELVGVLEAELTDLRTQHAAANREREITVQHSRQRLEMEEAERAIVEAERDRLREQLAALQTERDRPLDDDANVLLNRCEDKQPLSLADQRELYLWFEDRGVSIMDMDDKIATLTAQLAEANRERDEAKRAALRLSAFNHLLIDELAVAEPALDEVKQLTTDLAAAQARVAELEGR